MNKNQILTFLCLLFATICTSQVVLDSSYIVPAEEDSMFYQVREVRYSDGTFTIERKIHPASTVASNIRSFIEFRGREMHYAASSVYAINRRVTLMNGADSNLSQVAGISPLSDILQANKASILGGHTLNGDAITIQEQGQNVRWVRGGSNGAVIMYSPDTICLKGYFQGRDLLLYKFGEQSTWANADGMFLMN